MTPGELQQKPTSRTTMKEQERERRRMRDRQRRQSMSNEEREKHLARRRRNYQLRKQRTGEPQQLDSHQTQTSISTTGELIIGNENQPVVALHDCGTQDNDGVVRKVDSGIKQVIPGGSNMIDRGKAAGSEGFNSPRRLSINQIRHLARLLNTPIDKPSGGIQQNTDAVVEHSVTRNCGSSRKPLRLIHVKRLARALNSTIERISDQSHFNEAQGTEACSGIESATMIDSIDEQ